MNDNGACLKGTSEIAVEMSEKAHAEEKPASAEAWRAWVMDSVDQGAGALHKWVKGPEVHHQTVATLQDGTLPAEALKVLGKERGTYKGLWGTSHVQNRSHALKCGLVGSIFSPAMNFTSFLRLSCTMPISLLW